MTTRDHHLCMPCWRAFPLRRRHTLATTMGIAALAVLTACGGSGPEAEAPADVTGEEAATPQALPSCATLPPMPQPPAAALQKLVTSFGAVPNDEGDDTQAIDNALKSLREGEWLVFPPGRYKHSRSLQVRTPNVVLWGEGATLHATNPQDMAVFVRRGGVGVYNFTLTADTDKRLSAPQHARIALYPEGPGTGALVGNVVRGNKVLPGGGPNGANSASSGGIFVYRAHDFLVADNLVTRSLADGIHITGGSARGRVLNNTVRETGDDMIAVVSYLGNTGWWIEPAQQVAQTYESRRNTHLVHDVLIEGNNVSGQYWGRGITVVGGEHITIRRNTISDTPHAAGILLAREQGFVSFGVSHVLVRDNVIQRVQLSPPAYRPPKFCEGKTPPCPPPPTHHGGVEVHALAFLDELSNPVLQNRLGVTNVLIEGNTVTDTLPAAMRLGVGSGRTSSLTHRDPNTGVVSNRAYTGGQLAGLMLVNNRMARAGGGALNVLHQPTPAQPLLCQGNTLDGAPTTHAKCVGDGWPVVGAKFEGCR
jgi:parallel beta-helix repeat protein